jgi:glycosyltransferase involved in cell wall biosynthesis
MRSYIVVVSPSYGGAEKRFFDVFTSLRRQGTDVVMVGPSSLLDGLRRDHPDRHDVFDALLPIDMGPWSRVVFIRRWRRVLKTLPRGAGFHYPLNCLWFLHLGRDDRVTMSVADCTQVPGPLASRRTSVWAWLAFFFVQRIDVLSPAIFAAMRRYRTAARMTLTPGGTFVVPNAVQPRPKRAAIVFLGRLVAGKGVDDLLDVLPTLWPRLRGRVPEDTAFEIAGYGALEQHVASRASALAQAGIPVRFKGYVAADDLLADAAVLLSMQETTNYPSRVVAEALLCGCGAIVRDTGDSREFGTDLPGLVYCRAALDAAELADQLATLVNRAVADAAWPALVREAARARFSSRGYIDYFHEVLLGRPGPASPAAH